MWKHQQFLCTHAHAHTLLLFSFFFGSFTYSGDLEQQIFTGFKLALSLFKTHIVNHLHPFTVAVLRSPNFTTNIVCHSASTADFHHLFWL